MKEFKVIVRYNESFFIPLDHDQLKKEFITTDPFSLIEDLKKTATDISALKNQLRLALSNNDYSSVSEIANKHNHKFWMIKGADIYDGDKLDHSFNWI